jgi:hypothetical protein
MVANVENTPEPDDTTGGLLRKCKMAVQSVSFAL